VRIFDPCLDALATVLQELEHGGEPDPDGNRDEK
jgi:hypothetical protein